MWTHNVFSLLWPPAMELVAKWSLSLSGASPLSLHTCYWDKIIHVSREKIILAFRYGDKVGDFIRPSGSALFFPEVWCCGTRPWPSLCFPSVCCSLGSFEPSQGPVGTGAWQSRINIALFYFPKAWQNHNPTLSPKDRNVAKFLLSKRIKLFSSKTRDTEAWLGFRYDNVLC